MTNERKYQKVVSGFSFLIVFNTSFRAIKVLSYDQGVEAFRVTDQLSDSERSTLMGGSLTKIYGWSPNQV